MRGNVILLVVRIAPRDVTSRFNSHGFVTISWQKRINVTIIFCGVCQRGNALPQSCENIVCIKICGDGDDDGDAQWFMVGLCKVYFEQN